MTGSSSPPASPPARTVLGDWHQAHGAKLVEFGGWLMPLEYSSIIAEHHATRTAAGLFDVSHMGRLLFEGPQAEALLNRLVTRDLQRLAIGQVGYALVTRDDGGVLDDVLVTRLANNAAGPRWLLVVNAGNRPKIADWLKRQGETGLAQDRSAPWAMLALQGPRAWDVLRPLVPESVGQLAYYHAAEVPIAGAPGIASRSGYTGEDGFELIVPSEQAAILADRLLAGGAQPCGLGARDTLRLEAGMPLYGHELSEAIDPFTAGLGFAVHLDKPPFIGQEALRQLKHQGSTRQRVGLRCDGRRVPREGYAVCAAGETIGHVTSGTFAPTLNCPLAMAYVERGRTAADQPVEIDIRGRAEPARIVPLPFYRRQRE